MPKKEAEFFDVNVIEEEEISGVPGQSERILSRDPETGSYTRILQFDPGCKTAETLHHDFWEEVYIIKGSLEDLGKNLVFRAGMYACRPPGMTHGPYFSKDGCTTIEMRYYVRKTSSDDRTRI